MPPARVAEGRRAGTRFRLFPQPPFLDAFTRPETIAVSAPAGSVGPGPSGERMYAVYPVGKPAPYGLQVSPRGRLLLYLPPWNGPVRAPATPDAAGHFDHIPTGSPQFEMAHLYGTVRLVLDVWERYFGRRIEWHFRDEFPRLELSILHELDNAIVGYGFLEVGAYRSDAGQLRPFSLNFDVIAHELGHAIIYSEVGLPTLDAATGEYYGFHESAADLTALVGAMHFGSVLDDVLEKTRGNLQALNELNRIAELSRHTQIRLADNTLTLWDFASGWHDEHALSQPMTAAVFDIFVDIFHEHLLARGLIAPYVEHLADLLERSPEYDRVMQRFFDRAYALNAGAMKQALMDARDTLGVYLAETWRRLSPDELSYAEVGATLLAVDRDLTGGRFRSIIQASLDWRGIGQVRVGPRLAPPAEHSHSFSPRGAVPDLAPAARGPYLQRMFHARRRTARPAPAPRRRAASYRDRFRQRESTPV